jgi:hypothetical protein
MSYLNNALIYLFNKLEEEAGAPLTPFVINGTPSTNPESDQVYMQRYKQKSDGELYKYLYDPNLAFSFRFHQRISNLKYSEKDKPWISIIFNTGEVDPRSNIVSQTFKTYETMEDTTYEIKVKRMKVPINFVFISNSMDYLYSYLGSLSYYWDRIVNFQYKQTLHLSETHSKNVPLVGQALNISPQRLDKLDSQNRGSLATAGYSFELVYFDFKTPRTVPILKNIDLQIKVVDNIEDMNVSHVFQGVIS